MIKRIHTTNNENIALIYPDSMTFSDVIMELVLEYEEESD
jgi:hypothetical protein